MAKKGNVWDNFGSLLDKFGIVSDKFGNTNTQEKCIFNAKNAQNTKIQRHISTKQVKTRTLILV